VTFNGLPAPLLYSSNGQINAIVPWGIQGAPTANVCVVYQSNTTNCMAMNVTSVAPGIFQMPSGYAAAVNQDGMINSPQNPAATGSVISLYVTGLGPVSPMPADGSIVGFPLPTLANGVKVWFIPSRPNTAFPGEVLYAGTAPLEVAGLYQINVLIPVIPLLPATVEVEVDLPDGSSVATAFPGIPIAIQPLNAGNGAPVSTIARRVKQRKSGATAATTASKN
jgi:uncharacterized protein (TIGR03437 family)